MPELPEIETVKNGLTPHLIDQTVRTAIIREHRLRWPIDSRLPQWLTGQCIKALRRRSKYLLIDFDTGSLIIHLGMSGKLTIVNNEADIKKHDHVDIVLDHGAILRYNDPRRFGAILWSEQPNQHPRLTSLGPEPLSRAFNSRHLITCCQNKQTSIKSLIMNAKHVVGVGNIYANEALFHSRIHPETKASHCSAEQLSLLVKHIKQTLRRAIKAGGTTLKDFTQADGSPGYFQQKLWVYGRNNKACHQCKTSIERIVQQQRSSFFCPLCQQACD